MQTCQVETCRFQPHASYLNKTPTELRLRASAQAYMISAAFELTPYSTAENAPENVVQEWQSIWGAPQSWACAHDYAAPPCTGRAKVFLDMSPLPSVASLTQTSPGRPSQYGRSHATPGSPYRLTRRPSVWQGRGDKTAAALHPLLLQ
jgi:hypothetical protein